MTKDAAFKRRVRARMAKTGERYAVARSQLDATTNAPQGSVDTEGLHVTNGDATVEVLRRAGLTEPILPWRDVLHDGPVPGGLSSGELRAVRARFIAGSGWADLSAVVRDFEARDRMLEEYARGPIVLWFEADLYDQLQIIQVLDQLRRLEVDPDRISFVSAGEFPGIAHFRGLGELQPDDLIRLREDETPLTPEALDLASAAWTAFTAPDPSGLEAIARTSSAVLRHLGEAFGRLMREYPAQSDGLSLTQRRILLAVEGGATTAVEVFREVQRRERRPYLGDTSCFDVIAELARGPHPLLTVDDAGGEFARRAVHLTAAGQDVLAGAADHVQSNGIDRWIGGVHLTGPKARWRYDDRRETLVNL
ncbi:hypothetical protein [Actinopolymorpha alba]|uniref:hypothetical protein n=1 Tax=Actinopolymorpha alba TaxID=533267 RepID=UPI000375A0B4|nr:hypothetical protein [Actinopolymorpha alba]